VNFLKRFNKEQAVCGGALALAFGLLLMGATSGSPVEPVKKPVEQERTYKGPPARSAEFVSEKFEEYWKGRNPFEGAATTQLPIPDVRGPEPRIEDLAVPAFRPGPTFETLNSPKTPVAVRYRFLTPGAPSVASADLPTQAEFDELKALVEPEMPATVDRRGEKDVPEDVVHFRNGPPKTGTATILEKESQILIVVKIGASQNVLRFPLSDIARDPEDPREYWIEKAWTNDEKWKKKSEKYGERDLEKHLKLARWAREKGMIPEAKQSYRMAIDAAKKRMDFKADFLAAVRELGELMQSRSDFNGALALYLEAAQTTQFDKAEFLSRAGDCLKAVGLIEGAADYYQRSTEESPRYVRGRVACSRALMELDRDATAKQLIAMLPNFVVRETPLADQVEGQVVTGLLALKGGDFRAARTAFDAALKLDAANAEAKNALGVLTVLEGNVKEGAALFVQSVKANPYFIDGWLNLGALYLASGNADGAEAMFGQARQRDPSSPEAANGMALVLVARNAAKDAMPLFEGALKLDPTNYYAHYALGTLQAQAADPNALSHYQGALNDEYNFLPAYYGAAMTYLSAARRFELEARKEGVKPEESDKARADALRSLVSAETLLTTIKDPSRPSTLIALGCVYAAQGRAQEARDALNVAAQSAATDPLIQYALGWIEYRYGSGEAKTRMESAKQLFLRGSKIPPPPNDLVAAMWIGECTEAVRRMDQWLETIVRWDERFEGPDGDKAGVGWFEYDMDGVKVTQEKGRCKFAGTYIAKDFLPTTLEREVPREHFLSFEATLTAEKTAGTDWGVAVLYNHTAADAKAAWLGIWVGFDTTGKLRRVLTGSNTDGFQLALSGQEVKMQPVAGKPVRIKLERGLTGQANSQKCWNIHLYNWEKGEYELAEGGIVFPDGQGVGKEYRVAIFGKCQKNGDYVFYADNVRILERVRR
jgi:tetratricopeptide (TPR) repeat protein